MKSAFFLLLPLPCLIGCLPEEPPAAFPVAEEMDPPAPPVVVSQVTLSDRSDRVDRSDEIAGAPRSAPRASDADRIRPGPVFFRLGAGYGAVGRVDLTPCRDRGLGSGYLRMRVTFAEDGTVAHAAVESPTPPPAEALACIGERLRGARVPAFEGGDVTLSKSVYVISLEADEGGPAVLVTADGPPK